MQQYKSRKILLIVGIPVLFALLMRTVFGVDSWQSFYSVMSVSFLLLLPFGVGALTIALSGKEKVKSFSYRFYMPWIPIGVFFVITMIVAIEGAACWMMILPVFLILSSFGGLTAGHFKLKKKENEKTYVSIIALLPLLVSPMEQAITKTPSQYQAYTFIDIHSSKEQIWNNVTRVKEIKPEEDKGRLTKFLRFPRPIRAELNYEGVGANREAIFDKGLIFHEKVLQYVHQEFMVFSIKANPYEIPAATMDKHIVVGGEFFDVLNGVYRLEKLNDTTFRLHLSSTFQLTTTFNFYASWWARRIMKDIQNNILQVIRDRSEKEKKV